MPKIPPEDDAYAATLARLRALTDDEIDRMARNDPINPEMTDGEYARAVFAGMVRETRAATGLTQSEFAERFQIALARLRDWEQARTAPDSVAIAYVKLIAAKPHVVHKVLKAGRATTPDDAARRKRQPRPERAA